MQARQAIARQPSADAGTTVAALPEEEAMRAGHYRLLATLLSAPPDQPLLDSLAAMESGSGAIGEAVAALAAAARETDPAAAEREFSALFIGLVEGEVVP